MSRAFAALCGATIPMVAVAYVFWIHHPEPKALGAATATHPDRAAGVVSPSADHGVGGRGALFHTPLATKPAPTLVPRGVSDSGREAGSSPAGGTFHGLDALGELDALVPTTEGLYLMTVDLWDEEDFRAHLREEAWIDFLPSMDDCRRGLADDEARALLAEALIQERVIVQLESLDIAALADGERTLATLRHRWSGTRAQLMERLDRCSGYPYWSTVSEEYGEWCAW